MSSRYDKRAIQGNNGEEDRPTLSSFHEQLAQAHDQAEQQRLAAHAQRAQALASTSHEVSDKLAALAIEEPTTDDDPRTLKDRLTTSSDEGSNAAIAALLARALQLHHDELILQLDPTPSGNLSQRALSAIFDSPDAAAFSDTDDMVLLPKCTVTSILATLELVSAQIGARVSVLHNPFDDEGKRKDVERPSGTKSTGSFNDEKLEQKWRGKTLRILVRRVGDGGAEDLNEVRVAVVGNVDAGKSSLLGVLTKGRLDDGRGRARVSLFRHKHEIESGRTSSVGIEVLGFGADGSEILPEGHSHALKEKNETDVGPTSSARRQQLGWEEIAAKAHKIISFSDLAGHERYLKTTLFGLTATSPDFVLLIVGGNAGLLGMSKEHLSVALALSIPIVVVVTKVDMTPPNVLEQTLKQLNKVLRSPGCRKTPVEVKDVGMAAELAANFVQEKACPLFLVSNVTGERLDLLRTFLNLVPTSTESTFPVNADFEFSVSDVFSVPFVGAVVSGVILAGAVAVGDTVLLGPDSLGAFVPTVIKSIQRKRVPVNSAEAGQSVSFALKRVKRAAIRKGMVLVAKTDVPPVAVRRFEGSVIVLYHNSLISPHYQAMLHTGSVRQTVQIESITDKPCIRTGDRATIALRFIKHGEFLRVGDRFLFREGRTKALGVVTKLLPNIKEASSVNYGH